MSGATQDPQDDLQIVDMSDLRKYYASIPHLIDDADLSPYAYRLYGHIKRVVGESPDGRCYQKTETLAKKCKMSAGAVSNAKQELLAGGFIRIIKKKRPQGGKELDVIFIVDVWLKNFQKYTPGANSPSEIAPPTGGANSLGEIASSSGENAISPHELKKNPSLKNNPLKKDSVSAGAETAPAPDQEGKGTASGDAFSSLFETPSAPATRPASRPSAAEPIPTPAPDADVADMLALWKELFPRKTQPKPGTWAKKIKARMTDPDFRARWRKALITGSGSATLQKEEWFQFEYFIRNEYNWLKILNNEFAWKDRQMETEQTRAAEARGEPKTISAGGSVNRTITESPYEKRYREMLARQQAGQAPNGGAA